MYPFGFENIREEDSNKNIIKIWSLLEAEYKISMRKNIFEWNKNVNFVTNVFSFLNNVTKYLVYWTRDLDTLYKKVYNLMESFFLSFLNFKFNFLLNSIKIILII